MKVTTIAVDEDVLKWFRDHFINISAFCREKLREHKKEYEKLENG